MSSNNKPKRDIVQMVRFALRDDPSKNQTLGLKEEHSEQDILNAAQIAIDEINEYPPYRTNYTVESAPASLILKGTIVVILKSAVALKARNFQTVNDGSVSLNREGNLSNYEGMLNMYMQEFYSQLSTHKDNLNIMAGFGY